MSPFRPIIETLTRKKTFSLTYRIIRYLFPQYKNIIYSSKDFYTGKVQRVLVSTFRPTCIVETLALKKTNIIIVELMCNIAFMLTETPIR